MELQVSGSRKRVLVERYVSDLSFYRDPPSSDLRLEQVIGAVRDRVELLEVLGRGGEVET